MTIISPWMVPVFISVLLLIWLVVASIRMPKTANGLHELTIRLQVAIAVIIIVWLLYALVRIGGWLIEVVL